MFDLRPVGYVIGLLVAALGASMLVPMSVELYQRTDHWIVFAESAIITSLIGGLMALATANGMGNRMGLQQTFLLTTGVWLVLPIFGAMPFIFSGLESETTRFVDAFFEAMSGLTTTGATVFTGLDEQPDGVNLWRGILQWYGGIGIIVVAMVFLPELRVGGMQIFKSEGFDTMGKVLPRAAQIAQQISWIYVGLTAIAAAAYALAGMETLDALVHAMTTISTGGFANHDASFAAYGAAAEYIASVFMVLAALPFVRYVQIVAGTARPLFVDPQIRAFLAIALIVVGALILYQSLDNGVSELIIRKSIFNAVSILTGTGYASADYTAWGAFATMLFFLIGLIGGCAGSTSCSIKVFRFQVLYGAVVT